MKVNPVNFKFLTTLFLTLAMSLPLLAAKDEFNRADGALGANWAAHSDMVIKSERLHNQSTSATVGWNSYVAVYNVVNANEAIIYWPTTGNGIAGRGAEYGGVVFVNTFSAGSNGYLINIFNKEIRLYQVTNGSPTGSSLNTKTISVSPVPGDRVAVKLNPSTNTFTVLINGATMGSVVDSQKKVSLTNSYAGVMLYHSNDIQNDIEAFEANVVTIVTDTTPPAKITNLSASPLSASSIQVTWTAVGDDGNTGTATLYDVRYSKSNITNAAEFTSATVASGISAPKQAGGNESFSISGLTAETKYYFAVKVKDDAGNWSEMSNVASTTTQTSGGGEIPTGTLTWKTDDFERTDLGADWLGANYKITSGELTLTSKIGGWNNLAVYQKSGACGAGMLFSTDNAALYNNAYVPAGLLILMDNANPAAANGYLVKRVAANIDVFKITGGTVGSTALKSVAGSQAAPKPGEKIEAIITDSGGTKTVKVYVKGQLDSSFDLTDASVMENMYVGVALYGGTNFFNNLQSFMAGYPGGSGAQTITVYAGNNQSGPISTQLPQPIQVIVTDENDQPGVGTLLDYQLIQGTARFDDIEDFVFGGQVWKEVEEGRILRANGRFASDATASKGQYGTYDWIAYVTRKEMFAVPFYLPQDGRYDIYVRCKTLDVAKYQFHSRLDNVKDSLLVSMPKTANTWSWVRTHTNAAVTVGMHDLKLIPYHADLQWDKIVVQNAGLAAPSGTGGEGPVFPNMTNENGIASTKVTFGTNANDDVIIYVYAYRSDGSQVEAPAVFTLDPTPGPAVKMERDPSVTEPVNATPGMASPALKVIIKDAQSNLVSGSTVNWRISQGDGTLTSPTSVSNAAGVASNILQLNYYQDTDYKVEASATGLTGSPIVFTIKPGAPPKKIVRVQPKLRQQGNVNTAVDSMLIVRVLKADDSPFEGYPVKFVVAQGNGKINTQTGAEGAATLDIATDVQGYSRAKWQLGDPGLNIVEARAANLDGNPIIFEAWAQTGQAANLIKFDGDNQSGYVGLPLIKPFILKVTDSNGFAVSEQEVKFEIQQGQNAYFDQTGILTKTAYTDNQGQARVTLTMGSVLNEEHVVKTSATGTALTPVYFRATPTGRIAKTLEYISGNVPGYQKATVNTQLAEDFIVRAKDSYNNPIADQQVVFKVMQGGGKFANSLNEITTSTDAQGLARARLTLGVIAGDSSNVVNAAGFRKDIPTQELDGSPIVFKATALPKPAAKMAKVDSTDAQIGEVGYALKNPIKVKVTDEFFNPVKNHAVTFKVRGQGGELEDTAGKATVKVVATDTKGIASIIWNMPAKPGIVYLDVTSTTTQGVALDGSPMQFIAEAVPGQPDKMIRVTKDTVFVGKVWQSLPQRMKVQITDFLGNPLIGQPVIFKTTKGDGLLNGLPQVTIQTADSGYASVLWTLGKKSGLEANLMEASASVHTNPVIKFKATGLPDVAFRLLADSSYTTYGTVGALLPEQIDVKIVDQFGNGVPGHKVDFEIVPVNNNVGYINTMGVTTASEITNAEGLVAVQWGLGPQVGSQNNKLRTLAKLNNVQLVNSPYIFTASATVGGATKIVKAINDSSLSSMIGNTLPEYLRVKVTDSFDNPIAQVPVRFQVTSRREALGGTLDGSVDSIKVKPTDSNGMAWVQFTLGGRAGYKINKVRVSAENGGVSLQGSPLLFEITGTSTNAKKIVASDGDNQNGFVGQFLPREIHVTALDVYNNPVKGQPIKFRIIADSSIPVDAIGSLGAGAAVDTSVNTDQFGVAAVKWRLGHFVGTHLLDASTNGAGPLEGSPLRFTATAKADLTSADSSLVEVTPAELQVSNGDIRSTVWVTLRDRYKNPVSGKAVSIQISGDGNVIIQPTSTTDASGKTIGFVSSRQSGIKQVTARDLNSSVVLSRTATVVFKPASAAKIAKAPGANGDTQKRNVGTVLEKPFKVLTTDQFGNPIKNVPVTYTAVTGGGMMVDNQPVLTDSLGIASAFYRLGLNAGANLVQASSAGLDGSPVNFSTIAEQPQQIKELVILSGDKLSGGPAQELPEPLSVRLLDNLSRPIYGKMIKFEVLANDAVITSENPKESNMYGISSATMKLGTTLGLNIIRASLVDLPAVSAVFNDTTKVIPGSGASLIQMVAGNNQYGTVGQMLPTPLTVRVTDDYNNPVPGVTVSFTVTEDQTVQGVGRLEGGVKALARVTNEFGQVAVYFTLGEQAGLNKVRVRSAGLSPEFIDFTLYGQSGSAHRMLKNSGDNQTGEMDRILLKPISVRVLDRMGNPAQGGKVRFIVLQGGGTIIEPQPVLSDANGYVQVKWRLGPRPNAYANVAQAIADGLPGGTFVETFNAIGDASRWPRLQLPSEMTVWENSLLSFKVTADGSDNPPITCQATTMPDSAAMANNGDGTWTFNWLPGFNTVQAPLKTRTFYAVFSALDMKGGKGIDSVKINVIDSNRAPQFTRYWPTTDLIKVEPGTIGKVEFGVETRDEDGDLVTVTWYVDEQQVAYGQTFTMDLNLYPPYKYYTVSVKANDHSNGSGHWWGVKVKVELVSFACNVMPYQGINLSWETGDGSVLSGFNVLRAMREGGEYTRINDALIPPSENGRYDFNDKVIAGGRLYYYKLEEVGMDGVKTLHGPVSAEAPLPKEFKLAQNYPNPFNPETSIRFDVPKAAFMTLEVYNILGQKVRTLLQQQVEPGYHVVLWDGNNDQGMRASSGVYYYRISSPEFNSTKKMALLK